MEFSKDREHPHRKGNYTTEWIKINSLEYVLSWYTFPRNYKDFTFQKILPLYKEYIGSQERARVYALHNQILSQNEWAVLRSRYYVCIPAYVDENIKQLLEVIKQQDLGETEILIFLNGFCKKWVDKQKVSKKVYTIQQRWQELWLQMKVISHLYDERKEMWSIRADMIDALVLSLDPTLDDPCVICSDADVWDMTPWYFSNIKKTFENDRNVVYTTAERRMAREDPKNLLWLNEKMFMLRRKQVWTPITSWPTTSFRVKDYCKVKGYYRMSNKGEDVDLWNVLSWYYANWEEKNTSIGKQLHHRVYLHARRAIAALMNGIYIECMWQWDFKAFEKSQTIELDKAYNLSERDAVIARLFNSRDLSNDELTFVEKFLNNHNKSAWVGKQKRKPYMRTLVKYWNIKLLPFCKYSLSISESGEMFKLIKVK